ncbi:hypothetical protein [Acidithiobacillus sulfuriphilus]|uniref:hypothetical protein n=1 Tax=Acidithiobacillus sulfuriphilus TaxID=1867749 RepID=UPI003F5F4CA4
MAKSKYDHYAMIQFLSEVEVLRPEKVKRRGQWQPLEAMIPQYPATLALACRRKPWLD